MVVKRVGKGDTAEQIFYSEPRRPRGNPPLRIGKTARTRGLKSLFSKGKIPFMERARPVVYYRKGCSKCDTVLGYLNTRNVGYDAVEVTEDPGAIDELQRSTGQTATPTLVCGRESLRDFGIPELNAFLDRHKLDSRPGDR
jgi:glutaredoxin